MTEKVILHFLMRCKRKTNQEIFYTTDQMTYNYLHTYSVFVSRQQDKQIAKQTDKWTDRQTYKQTERQINSKIDSQINR